MYTVYPHEYRSLSRCIYANLLARLQRDVAVLLPGVGERLGRQHVQILRDAAARRAWLDDVVGEACR